MAKEFVIKHGLIVHGEITGSDVRIDDWNSISASLAELNSNVSETVTTASIVGNVITFTKSDGTTFDTVVQEDTGSFFTSASVDLNTITFHYGDNTSGSLSVETGTTLIRVKNTSGGAISKGTPVYITGNVGATDMLQIAPADASDASKMPAVGLLLTDLGINGEGFVVQGGYLTGMTTDVIDGTSTTSNNTVYVKAGGGLTMTKPTGDTNYIQNIAKVARVHGTAGSFIVSSILRTNDVPNLPTGKIWVGDGNTVTSSFVHLDETNQRMGIGTDTPLKPLHIDNESVPVRLESDTHNAVVVNYRTDEVGTGNGIQVGARGASDFFVQQDVVSGGSSQWNVNVYVSQSGKVYLPNLDGGLEDLILYYNNETGELKPGAQPSTGSFFTSASVDYNRVTFTSGDGTTSTITIDTGSFEPDRQDTGSFFTSASVDLNTITFTQGDGTTEVITVHTGSAAGSDRWIQFNHEGSFGASHYLNYSGNRLNIDSRNSAPALKLSASLNNASVINFRAQNTVNNGIQVGSRGTNDFFVQQDSTVDNNPSQWNVNLYISQSGEIFAENLATATTSNTLYYNTTTGEVTYGAVADTGSYYVSSSNNQDNLRLFQGDGTSVSYDLYDPRNYVSSSVDLNRITFTQRGGTTEVVTIHTGSGATPGTPLNSFQFNSGSEFRGSTLFFDDTTKQVGINTSASAATLHVRGADNTTGSLLIETDSVGIAERAFASLDFRVADNDGTGYRKFAIIAENTGTNFGYGQLHFALNDSNNTSNARIADSKLTIDRTGRIFMPDLAPITKTDIVYYNTGTGEVSYGAAPAATDISALNTFTGSLQTEVNDLKAATGSYYVSSSGGGGIPNPAIRFFQADGTPVTYELNDPRNYVSSSVDLNRITFTQADGSTEVVTVHTGSGGSGGTTSPAGSSTELQFNNAGAFGATTGITYSSSPQRLDLDTTSILIEGKSVPIQLTEGSSNSKQTVISYAQSTTSNVGFRVGNNDLGDTGRDIFVIAHGTTDWSSSNTTNIFELDQAGSLIMSAYGSGNFTGTATRYLAVDADGNLIEESVPSGGGTIDTGSFYVSSSVDLNRITFTQGDGTTEVVTVHTGSAGGGGGSGTVNSGVSGYVAYYPSTGTTVDDTSGLYWDGSKLGINTTTPAAALNISGYGTPIVLDSSTHETMFTRLVNQYSRNRGIRLGNQGTSYQADNFAVEADLSTPGNAANWSEVFRVSGSGEMFAANLASATTANTLYYNTTTKEITYGSAPSGGSGETYDLNATQASTDVNLNLTSTSGTDDSNITLTAGTNITLTRNSATRVTIDAAGGSGTPGGSDSHVQFNNNGSFGGESDLRWDSSAARLGIKVPSADTVEAALHIAASGIPIQFSGATQAFIRARTTNSTDQGVRFGLDFGANDRWIIERHNGSSWINNFYVENDGDTTVGGSLMVGSNNTSATLGLVHVGGALTGTNISVYAANDIQTAGDLFATDAHIGGTSTPTSGKLQVTGNVSGVSIYASHDIVAYSDARSKVNVETIPNALEKVNAVRGVTYNKVEDPEGIRYMGVIAQELLEHLPEVVHQGEEGNYSVAYGNVVGVLIEAVKELTAKVEDLESRLGK